MRETVAVQHQAGQSIGNPASAGPNPTVGKAWVPAGATAVSRLHRLNIRLRSFRAELGRYQPEQCRIPDVSPGAQLNLYHYFERGSHYWPWPPQSLGHIYALNDLIRFTTPTVARRSMLNMPQLTENYLLRVDFTNCATTLRTEEGPNGQQLAFDPPQPVLTV